MKFFRRTDYLSLNSFLYPNKGMYDLPVYLYRHPILKSIKKAATELNGNMLDVGCGKKPYKGILKYTKYTGIDVNTSPHLSPTDDAIYDGKTIPFADSEFDSCICTEVLEHCVDPQKIVSEMARVLKPNGKLYATVPFVIEHHELPYDYTRFTRYGLINLFEKAGFDILWIEDRGGLHAVVAKFLYDLVGNTVSRVPFYDVLLLPVWILSRILLASDGWRGREERITLGWQILCVKK
jgi:SAM-dependent methyltransferase